MNHAMRRAITLENKQGRNGVLLHERDGVSGERVSWDGLGISRHQLLGPVSENVSLIFQAASQVAIGNDAGQFPRSIEDPGDPQSLRCDLKKRIFNRRVFADQRKFIAAMHQVFNAQQKPSA